MWVVRVGLAPVAQRSRLPPIHLSSTLDVSTEASAMAPVAPAVALALDLRPMAATPLPIARLPPAALSAAAATATDA